MYQIRQRFIFDGCGCLGLPAKYYNGFAYRQVGNDHFWRCTGGAKGGFWLFVGAFLREGQEPPAAGEHPLSADSFRWGTAGSIHADQLVEVSTAEQRTDLMKLLYRCAVPDPTPLLLPEEIPGFTRQQGGWGIHSTGWYTQSCLVLPLHAPEWAPEAEVFDIREGVYLHFPDGSSRLIRRRDFWRFPFASATPVARQGDCLVFAEEPDFAWWSSSARVYFDQETGEVLRDGYYEHQWPWSSQNDRVEVEERLRSLVHIAKVRAAGEYFLDRHQIVVEGENIVLRHPEHEDVLVPDEARFICLMPGSSRPFARASALD